MQLKGRKRKDVLQTVPLRNKTRTSLCITRILDYSGPPVRVTEKLRKCENAKMRKCGNAKIRKFEKVSFKQFVFVNRAVKFRAKKQDARKCITGADASTILAVNTNSRTRFQTKSVGPVKSSVGNWSN